MKLRILALLGLMACVLSGPAIAGSINGNQQVLVCDPAAPANCLKPAADGSLAVTGGAGGGGGAITAASGAYASGSIASGAIASGAIASGAIASGAVASGAIVDNAIVTLGAKADAKSTATDTTSVSAMSVLKQISASTQTTAAAAGTASPGTTPACGSVMPISQTTSTDLHTASGKTYICSIILVVPDAEVVSLVEGTGTVCATGIAAVMGATTAANGMSFSANGGFQATSASPWLAMQTTSDHLCLLQSGSGRIAGVITYNDH